MAATEQTSIFFRVEIYGWWRSGTGAGKAAQLDALCVRDRDDLPYLPGRHIRGLMRDAVQRLGEWDRAYDGAEVALFGEQGFRSATPEEANRDGDPVPYRGARRGALAFSDARMAPVERAAFVKDAQDAGEERSPMRDDLYAVRQSTAIVNGVAAEHSLRAEEIAVPMTLEGTIDFIGFEITDLPKESRWTRDWIATLSAAAPLIRAVGAKRLRGLGRAALFIGEDGR